MIQNLISSLHFIITYLITTPPLLPPLLSFIVCLHMHYRSRLRQLDTTAVHLLQKVREGLKRSQGYAGSRADEGNDIEVIASKYKNGIPPEVRS